MNDDYGKTNSERISEFIKKNLINGAIILICTIYVLKGLIEFDETGKSVSEIIADGTLSFIVGFTIKTLFSRKGLNEGLMATNFQRTMSSYSQAIIGISSYIDELDNFCKYKNENKYKEKLINYLVKYGFKYNLYINGYYDNPDNTKTLDKARTKALANAKKIRIFKLTPELITNTYDDASTEEKILGIKTSKYTAKNTSTAILVGIPTAILFGYYALKKGDALLSNMIWCALQVSLYVVMGVIQYMQAYDFTNNALRGKIKRILALIDEFNNLRVKYPKIFDNKIIVDDKVEDKEEKINELCIEEA